MTPISSRAERGETAIKESFRISSTKRENILRELRLAPNQALHVSSYTNWGEPERAPHRRVECSQSIYGIYITKNELASLAHSFYTYLKHQLNHLTIIVLLRLRSIYLGFIVVWSFIPRDTLYCRNRQTTVRLV